MKNLSKLQQSITKIDVPPAAKIHCQNLLRILVWTVQCDTNSKYCAFVNTIEIRV